MPVPAAGSRPLSQGPPLEPPAMLHSVARSVVGSLEEVTSVKRGPVQNCRVVPSALALRPG